jgi:hypothetical protein
MIKYFIPFMLASLSACSSTPTIVKPYPNKEISPANKVLVKPTAYIAIKGIDELPFNIYPSGEMLNGEFEIELPQGEHTFEVAYSDAGKSSTRNIKFPTRLEAGKRYILKADISNGTWRPKIIDVTTKPECWTFRVGATIGPKGCD